MSSGYGGPDGGDDNNRAPRHHEQSHHPHSSSPFDNNGGGVNLRTLSAGGDGDDTTSLLVASSIAPGPGDEPVRSSSLRSSLQAAAAAGDVNARPSSLPGTSLSAAATQRQARPTYQEPQNIPVPQLGQYQYHQHPQHQPQMHQYPPPHQLVTHPPHIEEAPVGLSHHESYGSGVFTEEDDSTPQASEGYAGSQPEDDGEITVSDVDPEGPVKLFVGQVPKSMGEEDLFPTFSDFGPIKELLVIRDKHTGQHRGCAFVTFWNASAASQAQQALHDNYTFPQGRKPVQIRPATEPSQGPTSSPESENKLFVGMTSRNADEHAIRELFTPYGEIREIYIIRNADGSNKGCAFLKFAHRESALSAIEALHDNYQMEGATRPLIVKFADTKAQRKARTAIIQKNVAGGLVGQGAAPVGSAGGYYMPSGPPVPVYPGYQQQGPSVPPPMPMPPHTTQYSQSPYPSSGYPPSVTGSNPHPPSYLYQHPSYPSYYPPLAHTNVPPVSNTNSADGLFDHQPRTSLQSRQRPAARNPKPQYGRQEAPGAVTPRPREGPAGANLFIYHLPHDLTDADLATAFNPFGNVISAKVYVDKYTGESKGFGFVSYDSVISAEQAIEQMNGFQIGSKRLKVQHKRINKPPPQGGHPGTHPSGQPTSHLGSHLGSHLSDTNPSNRQGGHMGAPAPILPSSLGGAAAMGADGGHMQLGHGLPQSLPPQMGRYHQQHGSSLANSLDVDKIADDLDNLEVNASYQGEHD
mmetsp:Transcript_47157/g.57076  ORF Transcript_47157/g.57076 Transcript_47157/m.57076 type:complete len:749 (-) Transcript_47157:388-2634(-)|eukprot:CAMPEP_0172515492 /NCGR_PEP_ID=MMETSP1066-20121228/268415_1 /TAXON_ID=671091 /ORGANISM="Coscinodiscus wailesii, Strain CCMP2513" /LENGTH=748 /DNA_ID=CAMNT_0013296561 /DNA_START=171 /DNA_END=2417 /DNA_ORIENTATION=-